MVFKKELRKGEDNEEKRIGENDVGIVVKIDEERWERKEECLGKKM